MQTESFRTKSGLWQGGGLSPTLSTVFMDNIIQIYNQKTTKLHVRHRHLKRTVISEYAFTDDVVIITKSKKDLQNSLKIVNQKLTQ